MKGCNTKFKWFIPILLMTVFIAPTILANQSPTGILFTGDISPDPKGFSREELLISRNISKSCTRKDQDTTVSLSQLITEYIVAENSGSNPVEMIGIIDEILSLDPESGIFWFYLGNQRQALNEYQLAIDAYRKSFQCYAESSTRPPVQLFEYMGYCHHMLGYYRQEMKVYLEGRSRYPDNPALIGRQAVCFYSLGNSREADKLLEQYHSYWKNKGVAEADILHSLGLLFMDSKNLKAERYFRKALELDPEDPEKQLSLARVLITRRIRVGEAMDILTDLYKSEPDNPLVLHIYGWGWFVLEDYARALEYFQAADSLYTEYNHHLNLHLKMSERFLATH
jgi:tetratricopeptide (TPR) repeat protein